MINRIKISRLSSVRGQKCQYQVSWEYSRNNRSYGCSQYCDSKSEAIAFSNNAKAMLAVSNHTADVWDENEIERIKKYSK